MTSWFKTYQSHHVDNLRVRVLGTEVCTPGMGVGPVVRDRYSIHFIHSGSGVFQMKGKTYELSAGQGFLVIPDQILSYKANELDPWQYSWISFHGYKAETYLRQAGLSADSPTFQAKTPEIADCFLRMREEVQTVKAKELRLTSLLYHLLSLLIEDAPAASVSTHNNAEKYVMTAIDFISGNYSRKMTISEISRYIGLDQSYLGSLFKSHTKMTLQQYLIHYRIERACILMKNELLTIGDIALSVGYEDPLVFTRVFKQIKKMPPNQYRKKLL